MAYCNESDIQKQLSPEQLIELTDDDGNDLPDSGIIEQAIADADAEIDSYLAGRYSVPVSPVPAVIRKVSVDIAIWNLYSRRTVVDENRKERYKAAIDLLKLVGDGKAALGADEPAAGEQQIAAGRTLDDRIFTVGKPSAGTTGTLDNY
jgi:phage gp36-like protein